MRAAHDRFAPQARVDIGSDSKWRAHVERVQSDPAMRGAVTWLRDTLQRCSAERGSVGSLLSVNVLESGRTVDANGDPIVLTAEAAVYRVLRGASAPVPQAELFVERAVVLRLLTPYRLQLRLQVHGCTTSTVPQFLRSTIADVITSNRLRGVSATYPTDADGVFVDVSVSAGGAHAIGAGKHSSDGGFSRAHGLADVDPRGRLVNAVVSQVCAAVRCGGIAEPELFKGPGRLHFHVVSWSSDGGVTTTPLSDSDVEWSDKAQRCRVVLKSGNGRGAKVSAAVHLHLRPGLHRIRAETEADAASTGLVQPAVHHVQCNWLVAADDTTATDGEKCTACRKKTKSLLVTSTNNRKDRVAEAAAAAAAAAATATVRTQRL